MNTEGRPTAPAERPAFRVAWLALAVTGAGILAFGVITAAWPGPREPLYVRTIAVASIGMGLFGLAIVVNAFRRRQRWAWLTLWYYPAFWAAHLFGDLPPGHDHVHQVVFIALSVSGLLLPVREFFPRGAVEAGRGG